MSDWRHEVSHVEWRYVKDTVGMEVIYWLEANTVKSGWSNFGCVEMDCAGEGHGEEQAREIVESHNSKLESEHWREQPGCPVCGAVNSAGGFVCGH